MYATTSAYAENALKARIHLKRIDVKSIFRYTKTEWKIQKDSLYSNPLPQFPLSLICCIHLVHLLQRMNQLLLFLLDIIIN